MMRSHEYRYIFKRFREILKTFPIVSKTYTDLSVVLANSDQEQEVFKKMFLFFIS
jgi:uncharacterized membrane protein